MDFFRIRTISLILVAVLYGGGGSLAKLRQETKLPLPDFNLTFTADDRLAENTLLHRQCSPAEVDLMREKVAESHAIKRMEASLSKLFFPSPSPPPSLCLAVCLAKGTSKALIPHPLPRRVFASNGTLALAEWADSACSKVELGFINLGKDPISVYWERFDGERRLLLSHIQRDIKQTNGSPGVWIEAYLRHTFITVNEATGRDVETIVCEHNALHVVNDSTSSSSEASSSAPVKAESAFLDHLADVVEMTVTNEWRKSRLVRRTFTGPGFAKAKLPLDLYSSMSTYYHLNRNSSVREEWAGRGVFVNWWEVVEQPHILSPPLQLRSYW